MSTLTPPPTHRVDDVELPSGVRLQYVEQGSPGGVPVVMLHGITDSWRSFEPVLPHLPPSLHVYALTQRGHGDAGRPDSHRLEDFVADLAEFMDAVGLRSAIICGHSLGSIVAMRFAIAHPERVDALVGMSAATTFAPLLADATAELEELGDPVDVDWLRGFQESTLARPIPDTFMDTVMRECAKMPLGALRATWDGVILRDFSERLGEVAAPTLLVWGDRDTMVPRHDQDRLLAAVGDARLIVHEGAGHALHWEDPSRFAAELTAFAGEVASAPGHRVDDVELPNGVRLQYVEQGSPAGVPVVLLHGLSDSWRSFEPVLPYLPSSVHAYALTQRGHGDASRPASYQLDEYVEDVALFLDAVGLDRAIVCGHSMGSIVATRFAIDRPERTAGLVVMAGATTFVPVVGELTREVEALGDPIDVDWLRGFQQSTLARPVPEAFFDIVMRECTKLSLDALRGTWDGVVLTDSSARLGEIAAPALLVWGDRDDFPRSEQDALLAAIPDARLIVHEGGGHAFHWEDPARFAAELAAFARAVVSRTDRP